MRNKFEFYALKLSVLIVGVFIAQVLINGFSELFVLNSNVFNGEIWRFLSAVFLHGGLAHLVYNLFALILFGSILESLIGGRKFLIVFFISGILANLISVNFYDSSLGASGAIFGIIGALVIIRPMLVVWAFGLPMPMFLAGALWSIGDVLGTIGFLTGNPIDNTGNIAHLSGMFFGMLFGAFYKEKRRRMKFNSKIVLNERQIQNWEDVYMGRS